MNAEELFDGLELLVSLMMKVRKQLSYEDRRQFEAIRQRVEEIREESGPTCA